MPDAEVHQMPPMVRPERPVPVVVKDGADRWPGFVKAWRGDRVYVEWTVGPGAGHVGWMPATDVERVTEVMQDVTD